MSRSEQFGLLHPLEWGPQGREGRDIKEHSDVEEAQGREAPPNPICVECLFAFLLNEGMQPCGVWLAGGLCRWEVKPFWDFLCYSVAPCTVCVPRRANYRLKMLLAKDRHTHYCSSERKGPVGSYLYRSKELFLPGPLCVCHRRLPNHRTFVLSGCPSLHTSSLLRSAGISQD